MGEDRKVHKFLVEKPKAKRSLRRLRHRGEVGIRMDLMETGWGGVEWIHLAQGRDWWQALVNAVMNFWVLVSQVS
jgi:hypothetical protein